MISSCCCDDVTNSCDPGPCPETAQWEIDVNGVIRTPDVPRRTATSPASMFGVGIVVPDAPGCGDDDSIVTYKCDQLGTPEPLLLDHFSTTELDDGSRLFRYRNVWSRRFPWLGFPQLPIPAVVEEEIYATDFYVLEKPQSADEWRESAYGDCLGADAEKFWRCWIDIRLNGTIFEARPPSAGAANWFHEPVLRYVAQQIIYRDHDYRWRGCATSGCCQWAPRAGARVSARRFDPPEREIEIVRSQPATLELTEADSQCGWPEITGDPLRFTAGGSAGIDAPATVSGDTITVELTADQTGALTVTRQVTPYRWRLLQGDDVFETGPLQVTAG